MRVCCQVAHRTLSGVHRTVTGAPGPRASEQATLENSLGALRYNSPDCPVSQRSNDHYVSTVDCKSEQ
jgi:hypothetical protein